MERQQLDCSNVFQLLSKDICWDLGVYRSVRTCSIWSLNLGIEKLVLGNVQILSSSVSAGFRDWHPGNRIKQVAWNQSDGELLWRQVIEYTLLPACSLSGHLLWGTRTAMLRGLLGSLKERPSWWETGVFSNSHVSKPFPALIKPQVTWPITSWETLNTQLNHSLIPDLQKLYEIINLVF